MLCLRPGKINLFVSIGEQLIKNKNKEKKNNIHSTDWQTTLRTDSIQFILEWSFEYFQFSFFWFMNSRMNSVREIYLCSYWMEYLLFTSSWIQNFSPHSFQLSRPFFSFFFFQKIVVLFSFPTNIENNMTIFVSIINSHQNSNWYVFQGIHPPEFFFLRRFEHSFIAIVIAHISIVILYFSIFPVSIWHKSGKHFNKFLYLISLVFLRALFLIFFIHLKRCRDGKDDEKKWSSMDFMATKESFQIYFQQRMRWSHCSNNIWKK